MKKVIGVLLVIVLLLGGAVVYWSPDFQKGIDAYDKKDYATALREWEPLAEQGLAIAQRGLGWMYADGNSR